MMLSADTLDEDRHYSNQKMGHRLTDMCVTKLRRSETKKEYQIKSTKTPFTLHSHRSNHGEAISFVCFSNRGLAGQSLQNIWSV